MLQRPRNNGNGVSGTEPRSVILQASRPQRPKPAAPGAEGVTLKGRLYSVPPDYTWLDSKLINDGHLAHTFPLISLRNYSK